ncbi:MAG: hypothetical protein J7539_06200 [Niabella sp.]|nr:hypothetical protein [Niabella sp.]
MIKRIFLFSCLLLLSSAPFAQELKDNFYVKVLSEELDRNIKKLQLPDLGKPFFISYKLRNAQSQTLRAERGHIVTPFSAVDESRMASVKLLVGDYHRNFDYLFNNGSYIALPEENNVDEIRRLLWLETDRVYKNTAQQYNAATAALKRVTVDQKELALDDLSKITPAIKDYGAIQKIPAARVAQWKPLLQQLSALFIPYPKITTSSCTITISNAEEYLVSSEGVVSRKPISQAALTIVASLPTADGNTISETHTEYVTDLQQLPDYKKLETQTKEMIQRMEAREKARRFEGSYLGPVLFEEGALADLISGFFRYGLGVSRKSILYPDNSTTFYEDKIGQKLIAAPLSLTALPHLKNYNGQTTTGAFFTDYDGVAPPDSLVLIKEGILKSLLNGRTPTEKFPVSRGFASGERSYSAGVLRLTADTAIAQEHMKKRLIKLAKEEGLPYAFIAKNVSLNYGQATYLYRVDTATMKEEMLTGVKFTNLNMRSLRRFIIASREQQLQNGMFYSVICPQSMLIGEIELEAENNVVKARPIIVSNPLLDAPVVPERNKTKKALQK